MSIRKKLFIAGGATVVVAIALAGAAVYYTLVPRDAPAQANLSDAVASLNQARDASPTATASTDGRAQDLTGTWVLAENGDSFVGYRVQEELASIGTFTAVGRTQSLMGTLTFDGSTITDVQVTADLTGLASDNSMRDGQLRRQALETNTYPTAIFDLTNPIELGDVPAEGETVSATAVGELTLHGVTRSVSIPLEGQLSGGYVVVVGSLDIQFADFGIQKPTSGAVLGVEDHGLLELQVVFQQGSQG